MHLYLYVGGGGVGGTASGVDASAVGAAAGDAEGEGGDRAAQDPTALRRLLRLPGAGHDDAVRRRRASRPEATAGRRRPDPVDPPRTVALQAAAHRVPGRRGHRRIAGSLLPSLLRHRPLAEG